MKENNMDFMGLSGKKLTFEERNLQHVMLQIQSELEREKQKHDPYYNLYNLKNTRNRNLCDPVKTELGAKNIDYEAAERIYKEQIV